MKAMYIVIRLIPKYLCGGTIIGHSDMNVHYLFLHVYCDVYDVNV